MTPRALPLLLALLTALLAAAPTPARAQDEAARAWEAGDLATAERLYGARLAADSSDLQAMHRVALIYGWTERYDRSLALFDRLLAFAPDNLDAQVDRARVIAWRGDPARAAAELDRLLSVRPAYLPALQARAQFAAWAGRYDESLATYGRILEITPDDPRVAYEQARVLSWASRFQSAAAVYDSLLRADPDDREALLGLGQVLAWASRLDSAEVVYRRVLATNPADADALRGLARVAAWRGDLAGAEAQWRRVLAADPRDAAALVGLSQTLRWQGRDAAALAAARRAVAAAPTDRDARTELEWAERAVAPRAAPSFTYESDSDGNRIGTSTAWGSFRPSPALEVRGDGYWREAGMKDDSVAPDAAARGGSVGLTAQLEPGWSLSAGVGASATDRATRPTWRASAASPELRNRVVGVLSYARNVLDATALLVAREVETDELALSLRHAPAQGWSVNGGAGWARFHGRVSGEDNQRTHANLTVSRRVLRYVTLGLGARTFAFERDLTDGYFDPDFYGLGELSARYGRELRRWALSLEAAPGVQQVGSGGEPSGAFRGAGSLAYRFGPGRQLGVSAGYANAGLQSLSPRGGAGYQYRVVSVFGSWVF